MSAQTHETVDLHLRVPRVRAEAVLALLGLMEARDENPLVSLTEAVVGSIVFADYLAGAADELEAVELLIERGER